MATAGVGMTTPLSLTGKDAAALTRTYWSDKTYQESLQVDPLINIPTLTGQVDPGNDATRFALKDGYLFHDITPPGMDAYAREVILQLTNSLVGAAQEGDAGLVLGNEEDIRVKYFTAFANDWGHGVTTQRFGINYRENEPTGVYPLAKPLLAQWFGEYNSWNARMAVVERISNNLTTTPISLTTSWNQNWHVAGLASTDQPVYDEIDATYQENIEDALDDIVTAGIAGNHLTISNVLNIAKVARDRYIMPLKIDGRDFYFMYVASEEYDQLRDAGNSGSFAASWQETAGIGTGEIDKVIPGDKFVIGEIVICRDVRNAVIAITGGPPSTGMAAFYLKQGRNDERTTATGTTLFNANLLLGKNALVKFQPERPHYEEQFDEYGKFRGVGYFGACSYMILAFDVGTKTATSVQQEGSMVVTTART